MPLAKSKTKTKTVVSKNYRDELTELYYTKIKRQPTLYEYLKACFTATSPNGVGGKFVETYYDKDCTNQQCHIARRSFDDLLIIAQTMYPRTSPKALARILFKMNENDNLGCVYCKATDQIVFKIDRNSREFNTTIHNTLFDKKGKSKYSLNDIYELRKPTTEAKS